MSKFPVDAPKRKVVKALEILGFQMIRGKRTSFYGAQQPGRQQNTSDHA